MTREEWKRPEAIVIACFTIHAVLMLTSDFGRFLKNGQLLGPVANIIYVQSMEIDSAACMYCIWCSHRRIVNAFLS